MRERERERERETDTEINFLVIFNLVNSWSSLVPSCIYIVCIEAKTLSITLYNERTIIEISLLFYNKFLTVKLVREHQL